MLPKHLKIAVLKRFGHYFWTLEHVGTGVPIAESCQQFPDSRSALEHAKETFDPGQAAADEAAMSMPGHPKLDEVSCPACAEAPVSGYDAMGFDGRGR